MNFSALVVHEAVAYQKRHDLSAGLAVGLHGPAIAQSRHSVKLFDDTRRGLDGVEEHIDLLMAAHSKEFLGNARFGFARRWETDLGVFTYDGDVIATTHYAHFNFGVEPERPLNEEFGNYLGDIGYQYGNAVRMLAAGEPFGSGSFVGVLDLRRISEGDYRSHDYYSERFDREMSDGVTAALVGFQATLNVVDRLLGLDASAASAGPLTKFRTVTLYHVLSGLCILRASGRTHDKRSGEYLDHLLSEERAAWLEAPSTKTVRNTLVHYGTNGLVQARLDPERPMAGVIEASNSDQTFESYAPMLEQWSAECAALMNEWCDAPR